MCEKCEHESQRWRAADNKRERRKEFKKRMTMMCAIVPWHTKISPLGIFSSSSSFDDKIIERLWFSHLAYHQQVSSLPSLSFILSLLCRSFARWKSCHHINFMWKVGACFLNGLAIAGLSHERNVFHTFAETNRTRNEPK